jgi:hypothetical protein
MQNGAADYRFSLASAYGFQGIVRFACKGAPEDVVCSIVPSSVAISPGEKRDLLVTLRRRPASTVRPSAIFLLPLGLAFAIVCQRRRSAIFVLALCLGFLVACQTPLLVTKSTPKSFSVTISAESQGILRSFDLAVASE